MMGIKYIYAANNRNAIFRWKFCMYTLGFYMGKANEHWCLQKKDAQSYSFSARAEISCKETLAEK